MTFAAPLFLLATLAGLLPVVLHLMHRHKAREVRFSTLRFLRISVQRTRRRRYVEDLSLLIVRVAVLLLIAIGLARPALASLAALWGGGRTRAIAVVLDNSASMAVLAGGQSRFEAARQGVENVFARMRQGDHVALLKTGGPPAPELGRLFRTQETVRQALDSCRPSYERADLAAKFQQASALLAEAEVHSKEIYIFTDNQNLSWEGLKEQAPGDEAQKRSSTPQVPIVLVNVQGDPAPNTALKTITLDSPAPVAGASFQAAVEVVNTAAVPQQKHLELHIDGMREAVSPTLSLSVGGTVKHTFSFTVDQSGIHRGEVRLAEEDGCSLDNRLYFAVTVDQQIPVAIVKPQLDEPSVADDAFYLERALAPAGSTNGAFRVTTLTPDSIAAQGLSGYAVIFCVNLPALSPPEAEKLREYAHDGGHIVWICGRSVRPADYNAMNALAQGELLPAMLEELRQPMPGGVESWHVGFLDKDNLALGPLTEPASLYQSIVVTKHFSIAWNSRATAHVLARLDDGQPLLAERPLGTGSVLLLGTALHVDWTNLPVKPIFLPLLTRLTFYLAGTDTERTMAVAGAPVAIPLSTGTGPGQRQPVEIDVVRPSGEVWRLREPEQSAGTLHYADTHDAGTYLVRMVGRKLTKQLAFAVNIDPAEVDPATITRQELQDRFGQRPLLYCESPANLDDTIQQLREGTSLWEWFLSAVLIGLVLEVFLANRGTASIQRPLLASAPIRSELDSQAEPTSASPEDEVRGFLEHLEADAAHDQGGD